MVYFVGIVNNRVGVIGDKRHAAKLISIIENNKKAQLNTVFHPKRLPKHSKGTCDFSKLIECDSIFIASPNHTHISYIKKLFPFKKYIFVEKPLTSDMENIQLLAKFKRSRKIYVNYNYRKSFIHEVIKDFKNQIGKIIYIDVISSNGLSFKKNDKKPEEK